MFEEDVINKDIQIMSDICSKLSKALHRPVELGGVNQAIDDVRQEIEATKQRNAELRKEISGNI